MDLPWNRSARVIIISRGGFAMLRAVAAFLRGGADRCGVAALLSQTGDWGRLACIARSRRMQSTVVLSHWRDIKLDCGKAPTHATRRGRTNAPQKCSRCKNIPRVRKCPDITRLNSLFAFCIFLFLSFCRFVWRKGSSLKSHSLCPNSKLAVSHQEQV